MVESGGRVRHPAHRRVRRQRSTGFRAFSDTNRETESDDFFTATEDEQSHMERSSRRRQSARLPLTLGQQQVPPISKLVMGDQKQQQHSSSLLRDSFRDSPLQRDSFRDSPLMRDSYRDSPLLRDSSSALSPLPDTHGSVTTPCTRSSCLYSDSSSFSSSGLGMPRMEEDCLEDLVDKLHGCLEETEGDLRYRAMLVRRIVTARKIRCMSDSFLYCIEDLDILGAREGRNVILRSEEEREADLGERAGSCIDLSWNEEWAPALEEEDQEVPGGARSVWVTALGETEEEMQVLAVMVWAAASWAGLPGVTICTQGNPALSGLSQLVTTFRERYSVGSLLALVLQYLEEGKQKG